MFGRRAREPYADPTLGPIERSRGAWRGRVAIEPFGALPLSVPGPRTGPEPAGLALAQSAGEEFRRCRTAIEAELAEHRLTAGGEPPGLAVAPAYVAVIRFEGRLTLEFGYRVPWDDDHTLGARVRDGILAELSGSVLEP